MYLIAFNGPQWFRLQEAESFQLGRDAAKATICIEDDSISPLHAQILKEGEQWWIEDLESVDGTYLGGEELRPGHKKKLHDGARIGVGLREYCFSSRPPLHRIEWQEPSDNVSSTSGNSGSSATLDTPTAATWTAEQLTALLGHEQTLLSVWQQLWDCLDFSVESEHFISRFLDLLGGLFGPERWVFVVDEKVTRRGKDGDDPWAELILHQARFQMSPLAFRPKAVRDAKGGSSTAQDAELAKSEDHSPEEAWCSACYAPLLVDELVRGYVYMLASPGEGWSSAHFRMFASLATFASRGVSAFQVLHRAQEDREVLHLNLVGIAPEMQKLKTELLQMSQSDAPLLIQGEEGVGKSRIARAIHQSSARRQAPLLILNAANFPKELFEAEICGAAGQEVNGTTRGRAGKVELAEGGSFLIEEIGELPLGIQPTLVALLKSGQYTPVGSEETRLADVRMMFTSNIPLRELLQQEKVIPELGFLLQNYQLHVPSLRQRKEDIPQLFRAFLGRFGEEEGLPTCVVADDALQLLKGHRWTYNIRELRDIVARCFYEIDPEHPVVDLALMERVLSEHQKSRETNHTDILGQKVREQEHRLIQEALMAANDDIAQAARALGVSRVVLWRKMRALAIG